MKVAFWLILASFCGLGLYWLGLPGASPRSATTLFLGDSLTRRGDWNALLGKGRVANHGVDGDTSAGALRRLAHLLDPPPEKVFVMIGVNDLGQNGPGSRTVQNLLDNHAAIVNLVREKAPKAEVFLLSLLPVRSRRLGGWIDNRTIVEVNQRLAALAAAQGHAYLDLHARLLDPQGEMDGRYTDDGVHLTPAAYQVWRDLVAPLL